jgi:hypothetical protein
MRARKDRFPGGLSQIRLCRALPQLVRGEPRAREHANVLSGDAQDPTHLPERPGDTGGKAIKLTINESNHPSITGTVLVGFFGRCGSDIDSLGIIVGNGIDAIMMDEFEYHLSDADQKDLSLEGISSIDVPNETIIEQTSTQILSREVTNTASWSNTTGVTVGAKTTLITGIPFIAQGEIEISVEGSYEYAWGEALATTHRFDVNVEVTAPPMTMVHAELMVQKSTLTVPFEAKANVTRANGTKEQTQVSGTFTGVNSHSARVEYSQSPLP